MFVVTLKFSANKSAAPDHMAGHNQWIKQGFDEGVFLLAGSLQPNLGGAILAHNVTLEALEQRINKDPFVEADVVKAEVLSIDPKKTDERLKFLLPGEG